MNDDLVKSLREKTEEADLDTIMKTSLFGYSRKSVREYISMMRQQQHDMQLSFSEEMRLLQAERDRLTHELEDADGRAADAEDALNRVKPMMEKVSGLEKDMDEAVERIRADAERLEQLNEELERQKAEVQRIRSERDELRARLEKEHNGFEAQDASEPTNEVPHEGPSAEEQKTDSGAGVANLIERPESMEIQLAILTRERDSTAKRLESVIRQEKSLFHALNECRAELENRLDQNHCLEAENADLISRLSEQMWQNISLNREITHMRALNESLKRRLEAAAEGVEKRDFSDEAQDTGDEFPGELEQ